jgi:molybdenum ABC transporter molybdate-binding protein
MHSANRAFLASLVVAAALIALLAWSQRRPEGETRGGSLVLYCAAGLRPPVEGVIEEFEKTYGTEVQVFYEGSGALLSSLKVAKRGDLYLAADEGYLKLAEDAGLVAETFAVASLRPVIAVARGNPKRVAGLRDLLRADVRVALANPEQAAVGKETRRVIETTGDWEAMKSKATVFKPTVVDIANDVKVGAVDAAVVWDATVRQYPDLEAVQGNEFDASVQRITLGVLRSSTQPAAALRFARFFSARDRGLKHFERLGYEVAGGDVWEERPVLVLYSGGVNRLAIEETLRRFEAREGLEVRTVYGGCGTLCAQMQAVQTTAGFPDAYFACDAAFLEPVADLFLEPKTLSETDVVIAVAKGNPRRILELRDLAQDDLRFGVANPQQSALGKVTERLLGELGLADEVAANVRSQTPTADLLVNQLLVGSLDAVLVYRANTSKVRDQVDVIALAHPAAKAVQPYAVSRSSAHRHLAERLRSALEASDSVARFEAAGFRWRGAPSSAPSRKD